MKLKKTYFCLFLSVLILCFSACNSPSEAVTEEFFALDTVIDITAYGVNADNAIKSAKSEALRLESLLSVTYKDSDIYRINSNGNAPVSVSDETLSLIAEAVDISEITGGLFDPTIYGVLKLWGFTDTEYRVPDDDEISRELREIGYDNILIENNTVSLKSSARLDLGGIAKGFIADKMAEAMLDAGCEYGLISLGGNIRTVGHKPSGETFNIGIKHPEYDGYFAVVSIDEGSVITSGAYQRYFTVDGVNYHHIIDPDTGYPSESDAVSVTVIGTDGAVCDALSTAIFVGGTEYADRLYNEHSELSFEYLILSKDSKLYASKGLESKVSLASDYEDITLIYSD